MFRRQKSTLGYVLCLGSEAVSWMSKKQPSIALSSTKAEYMVAITITCQTTWMRRVLANLKQRQEQPTIIFYDNKSTISL